MGSGLAYSRVLRQEDLTGLARSYAQSRSKVDRDRVIEESQTLVRIEASRIHRKNPRKDIEDLVGYGNIGLCDAVDKYDLLKNTLFESYAINRIRGAILDGIREERPVSKENFRNIALMRLFEERYFQEFQRDPNKEDYFGAWVNLGLPRRRFAKFYDQLLIRSGKIKVRASNGDFVRDLEIRDALEEDLRHTEKIAKRKNVSIIRMLLRGKKHIEIARKLRVSGAQVSNILNKYVRSPHSFTRTKYVLYGS